MSQQDDVMLAAWALLASMTAAGETGEGKDWRCDFLYLKRMLAAQGFEIRPLPYAYSPQKQLDKKVA
jgi:hypothetical protein